MHSILYRTIFLPPKGGSHVSTHVASAFRRKLGSPQVASAFRRKIGSPQVASAFRRKIGSMSDRTWTIDEGASGLRLDKYLADPDRLGSRARAVTALERGKVYLNGKETGLDAAGVRLSTGDTVRLWMDRPGSA